MMVGVAVGFLGTEMRGLALPCGRIIDYHLAPESVTGTLWSTVAAGCVLRDGTFQPFVEAANDAAAGLVLA